jgi:hypothetical protein
MAFRVVYVNRDQMSVVKLKTASEAGKKIAFEYCEKYKSETIQSLLDEILRPPKPPTPPPPPPPKPIPAPVKTKDSTYKTLSVGLSKYLFNFICFGDSVITAEETKAQKYAAQGDIDLALLAYRRIQPTTPRVLNAMGQLCADRKGDYDYALQCHEQALKMQEEVI